MSKITLDTRNWLDRAKRAVLGANEPAKPASSAPARPDNVHPVRSGFDKAAMRAFGFRKGMWVVAPAYGVGILTGLTDDGVAEVMLVTDDGSNKLSISTQAASLRQAAHAEIPGPRRPHPEEAARLGYL